MEQPLIQPPFHQLAVGFIFSREAQSISDIVFGMVRSVFSGTDPVSYAYFAFDAQGIDGESSKDMHAHRSALYKKRYPVASEKQIEKNRDKLEAGTMVSWPFCEGGFAGSD